MREYLVRPGDDVQAAFDRAEPGSLIRFEAGIYRQKLMLKTPELCLEGAGADATVLLWGDYAKKIHTDGKEFNTFRTWTLAVSADESGSEPALSTQVTSPVVPSISFA